MHICQPKSYAEEKPYLGFFMEELLDQTLLQLVVGGSGYENAAAQKDFEKMYDVSKKIARHIVMAVLFKMSFEPLAQKLYETGIRTMNTVPNFHLISFVAGIIWLYYEHENYDVRMMSNINLQPPQG